MMRISDQLFNSSEKRLARRLLLLANFGRKRNRSRHLRKSDRGFGDDRNDPVPGERWQTFERLAAEHDALV